MWNRSSSMAAILLGAVALMGGATAGVEIEGTLEGINPQTRALLLRDGRRSP